MQLRDVAKAFGAVRAVDGIDLDVPEGSCVGLLGPNGAGKSTTMKMLTAQAIADRGSITVLGFKLPEESKSARALMGVVPQQDNLDTTLTVQQNLTVFTHLYRVAARRARGRDRARARPGEPRRPARHEGGQAVRRHAAATADRPGARAPAAARTDGRADRRPRPAGPPGDLGADRRPARRGRLDPDVDALHRGGRAARRPRDDHVARQGRRRGPAVGPRARARRHRGGGGLRPARPARRGGGRDAAAAWRPAAPVPRSPSCGCNGNAPEGERRPANLEDVFVLLTGEEIA